MVVSIQFHLKLYNSFTIVLLLTHIIWPVHSDIISEIIHVIVYFDQNIFFSIYDVIFFSCCVKIIILTLFLWLSLYTVNVVYSVCVS